MAHWSLRNSASHSASFAALVAPKVMPDVPNWAALDACGASRKTSPRHVISNRTKPAATTVA